jgi:hypothetical protein
MLTHQQIIDHIGHTIRRNNVIIKVRDYDHAAALFAVQAPGYEFDTVEVESKECNACQA